MAAVCERVWRAGEPVRGTCVFPPAFVVEAVTEVAATPLEVGAAKAAAGAAAVEATAPEAAVDTDGTAAGVAAAAAADGFGAGGSDMLETALSHTALAGGWAPNVGTALGQVPQQVQQDSGGDKGCLLG